MAGKVSQGYSGLQIALHWIVAAMVIFQIVGHDGMVAAWRALRRGAEASASDLTMAQLHIWIGFAIGALALWRLSLRFTRGAPALPGSEPMSLRLVATGTHILLYALMIGLPISGALAWYLEIYNAGELHEIARLPLIALVLIHFVGALAQKFWFKTDVMDRMVKAR